MKYRGWIAANEEDRKFLEDLGVEIVGPYNQIEEEFPDCELSQETLDKLEPYWNNKFFWGLHPVEDER